MNLLISLFSPATGTWGGITRGVAVAEAARNAGHKVAFCAAGYVADTLQQRGYTVYAMPQSTMLGLPAPLSRLMERRSQRASIPVKPGKSIGNIWLVLWLSGYAQTAYLRRLAQAEIRAVENFQADRIFTDINPGAFLASAVSGVPIASTYAHVATHGSRSWAWKRMQHAVEKVLRAHKLPTLNPDELCFGGSVLKIIPSIPELDDTASSRPDVRYVGHLIGPVRSADTLQDIQIEDKQRYVFVYVGTGSISLNVLQTVLPQLFPSADNIRCFVGAQSITAPYQVEGVTFRPYVPAEKLLLRCNWTICHGGQNTIIQSLLHSVPLIIFPGPIFERRYNAQKIAAAKAGIMGEVNQFTAEWLRAVFNQQQKYALQATALGDRLRSYGGASAAVDAITTWHGQTTQ
jgi:UDP:flavonoid glycosyltransferase YjiC (YdhE family)